MAYRFTNTDKWNDAWFSDLKPLAKLLFMYLCDQCDIAGFLELNVKKITFDLGCDKQGLEKAMKEVESKLIISDDGRFIFINNFLKHQRNLPLSDNNRAHIPIKRILTENLSKFKKNSIEALLQGGCKGDISLYGNSNGNSVGIEKGGVGEINPPPLNPPDTEVPAEKSWRESFDIYLSGLREAYREIIQDKDFIAERERYHPELNIKLTLEKSCKDYWSREVGWKKKKSSRSVDIDWKSTFKNALNLLSNQVRKTKEEKQNEKNDEKRTIYV